MLKRKNPAKAIINILIITTITVVLWIGFDVHRAVTKQTDPKVSSQILKPLNPVIDTDSLKELQERLSPTEQDFQQIPGERRIELEITESSPSATPSGEQES